MKKILQGSVMEYVVDSTGAESYQLLYSNLTYDYEYEYEYVEGIEYYDYE